MRGTPTRALIAATLAAGLGACSDQGAGRDTIVITGSSTIAPVLAEIAKRYESEQSGIRIDVQTGGSSRGIADARSGSADIGTSSRALSPQESPGLSTHVLARDGVSFIIHRDNPVAALSEAQIRDIFTGRIDNWQPVGGRAAPITVVNRADGRSERELIMARYRITPQDFAADLIVGENEQGIKTIAGDPNAITYMSLGTSEYDQALGIPIKLLPLAGVAASSDNVASGAYPLSRPLLLITPPAPRPAVREFLAFARSAAVHDIIRAQSFVPVP